MTQCSACLHYQTQEVPGGNGTAHKKLLQTLDIDVTNTALISMWASGLMSYGNKPMGQKQGQQDPVSAFKQREYLDAL